MFYTVQKYLACFIHRACQCGRCVDALWRDGGWLGVRHARSTWHPPRLLLHQRRCGVRGERTPRHSGRLRRTTRSRERVATRPGTHHLSFWRSILSPLAHFHISIFSQFHTSTISQFHNSTFFTAPLLLRAHLLLSRQRRRDPPRAQGPRRGTPAANPPIG